MSRFYSSRPNDLCSVFVQCILYIIVSFRNIIIVRTLSEKVYRIFVQYVAYILIIYPKFYIARISLLYNILQVGIVENNSYIGRYILYTMPRLFIMLIMYILEQTRDVKNATPRYIHIHSYDIIYTEYENNCRNFDVNKKKIMQSYPKIFFFFQDIIGIT